MNLNQIIEIDFARCFNALVKYSKQLIVITIASFLIGLGISNLFISSNDEYTAKSSVYSIVYGSYSESAESLQAMMAYADIIKSYKVAERASLLLGDDTIDMNTIYDMITATYNSSTYTYSSIVTIEAVSENKNTAIKVANAVAEAFVLEIASLTGKEDVQQLDTAYDASVSYDASATKIKTVLIFTLAGLILGCAFIFIREIFSLKMYYPKDITLYGKLDIIGVIPEHD